MVGEGSGKEGEDIALPQMHIVVCQSLAKPHEVAAREPLPFMRSVGHVLRIFSELHSEFRLVILIQKDNDHNVL